jgi:hypothetical protein
LPFQFLFADAHGVSLLRAGFLQRLHDTHRPQLALETGRGFGQAKGRHGRHSLDTHPAHPPAILLLLYGKGLLRLRWPEHDRGLGRQIDGRQGG